MKSKLNPLLYEDLVRRALREDLGLSGDQTTDTIVPEETVARGKILVREEGCLAGVQIASEVFSILDRSASLVFVREDGESVRPGDEVIDVRGRARALLTGERTALNFLGHLSGIATVTRRVVDSVVPHSTRIVCTRKTTPGLRALEKYAVRVGGGSNHRFGLNDAILIKENHIAVAGGVGEAVRRAREGAGHLVKLEIEVENLRQLREVLDLEVDAVLLDNMSIEEIREAVGLTRGKLLSEVSGGIRPERAAEIAATGVDLMSVGWLTHSAPSLDLSMEIAGV